MSGLYIGPSSRNITENTHDQIIKLDQDWEVTTSSPSIFWNNPTTSPTGSSNFFTSEFEDSFSANCHDYNGFTSCEGANDDFRSLSSPPPSTRDSLPLGNQVQPTGERLEFKNVPGTELVIEPITSPLRLLDPATTFMIGSSLHYPQRSWEMVCQAEPLYIDPEHSRWQVAHDLNSKDARFSSNGTFFDFAIPLSPPPTAYAIRSPWPSEIYTWATAADKTSPPSYSESPPDVIDEIASQPASASSVLPMPELIQKHQDNVKQKSFLCIEENCDRSAPGNGFATKSGSAAHWKKQHATHCEKCRLEFASPEILKEHRKKTHRVIICLEEFCPHSSTTNGFRFESELKSHQKSCHESFSTFPCATLLADRTICLSSFSAIERLRVHKRRVHRAKIHLCTQETCPRSISGNGFKLKSQLKLHLYTHLRTLEC